MHDYRNGMFYINHKIIELTPYENEALYILIMNKGRVVNCKEIAEWVYKSNVDKSMIRSIQCIICKLRKKMNGEIKIKTRKQYGYMLEEVRI